jgi:hypothetical protein
MENVTEIGSIANYYGCLSVKKEDDKYYWAIGDHDGHEWEEIPKSLYDSLMDYQKQMKLKCLKDQCKREMEKTEKHYLELMSREPDPERNRAEYEQEAREEWYDEMKSIAQDILAQQKKHSD